MGEEFLTLFNKIRDVNKTFSLLGKKYPVFEELYLENYWTHKAQLGLKL
jgi:hypothetical protein